MTVIVSNTSPISNLVLVGEISLLQQIYPKVLIPPVVHTELMRLPALWVAIAPLMSSAWLEIQAPTDLQLVQTLLQALDPGEAEAIALAVELKADRLLIDERLGRTVAATYGLQLRGIIGILIYAKQQNLIPALKPILDRLIVQTGFRVSQALYNRAIQEAGE